MSDMTNDLDVFDFYGEWGSNDPDPFKTVRKRDWITKAGDEVRICDMTDKHLFNAFNLTKDETLFQEMVWRLFEQRIKEVKPPRIEGYNTNRDQPTFTIKEVKP